MSETQGKNKRRQLEDIDTVHNVKLMLDSPEEQDFLKWCCEAVQLSVINDFQYQPNQYTLSEAVKFKNVYGKENTLFQEHVYSPDFLITMDPRKYLGLSKEFHISYSDLSCQECSVIVDIKGAFAKNDGGRSFSLNQKWMYQKFKQYICKIVPKKFFAKAGVPEECLLTKKTKKPRTMFSGFPAMKDIFES